MFRGGRSRRWSMLPELTLPVEPAAETAMETVAETLSLSLSLPLEAEALVEQLLPLFSVTAAPAPSSEAGEVAVAEAEAEAAARLIGLQQLLTKSSALVAARLAAVEHRLKPAEAQAQGRPDLRALPPPSAATGAVPAAAAAAAAAAAEPDEPVLLRLDEVSCTEPRGKFTLLVTASGITLRGKALQLSVAWSVITHLVQVTSPTTTKKEGEDLFVVRMNPPVRAQSLTVSASASTLASGKEISALLWTLSKAEAKPLSFVHQSFSVSGTEALVVPSVMYHFTNRPVVKPRANLFQTVASSKPYLACYRGIQEGYLFPLQNGLLFLKPVVFIPADQISSLSAGRGGSAGSTRYVDLLIDTIQDVKYEFSNIPREELSSLQQYIKLQLEANKPKEPQPLASAMASSKREASSKRSSGAIAVDEDDNEDNGDDSDEDGDCGDDDDDEVQIIEPDAGGSGPRVSKRVRTTSSESSTQNKKRGKVEEEEDDDDDEDDDDYDPDEPDSNVDSHSDSDDSEISTYDTDGPGDDDDDDDDDNDSDRAHDSNADE